MQVLSWLVSAEDGGRPVRWLARQRMHMSCAQFKSAKFGGALLLDGVPVHADRLVIEGQTLTVRIPEDVGAPITPYALPLTVAYEDDDLLIVDKPAPLPSIGSPRKDEQTLENAVYAYLGCPAGYLYRPVNRLDKGTSGLMAIAKHAHAQQYLQAQLHTEAFRRAYLAVVDGSPPEDAGVIDLPIGKADGATIRREVRPDGRSCRTRYRVVTRGCGGRSLIALELETGRTHQIRVHMQALGCPVTGDFLYGAECAALPGRFALHSNRLWLTALSGEKIALESPLPPELANLIENIL